MSLEEAEQIQNEHREFQIAVEVRLTFSIEDEKKTKSYKVHRNVVHTCTDPAKSLSTPQYMNAKVTAKT